MWHNRDHFRTLPTHPQPAKHVSGCTAYAEEDGVDIVYVGAPSGSAMPPSTPVLAADSSAQQSIVLASSNAPASNLFELVQPGQTLPAGFAPGGN